MLPPWLAPIVASLPLWVQWLVPVAMQVVQNYLFPAIVKAFPAEAPLVKAILAWLMGQPVPVLKAAHAFFHAEHAKLVAAGKAE